VPPVRRFRLPDTHRLVPSRYPPVGILDAVASPADLELIFELEGWSNDRISHELGVLRTIPPSEWVVGRPMASVIMAAFCHPHPQGGRFNDLDRGAWYAGLSLPTAHAEAIYRRTRELAEIGLFDARVQMRQYHASFDTTFHDICARHAAYEPYYDPDSYAASQAFARELFLQGSNGIVYRSVRDPGGECVVCFRPPLVTRVRQGSHFEYRWSGGPTPTVTKLR
jgi:hypothetical protein